MNRRGFLGGLLASVAGGFTATKATPPRRYGPMTIERHRHLQHQGVHLHVFHRGHDVTHRCTFADDTGEGMARLFVHDSNGKPYWNPDVREIVYGVTFQEGAPFA